MKSEDCYILQKKIPCPSVDIVNKLSFEPSTILTLLGVLWKQSGARGFNDDLITYKYVNYTSNI